MILELKFGYFFLHTNNKTREENNKIYGNEKKDWFLFFIFCLVFTVWENNLSLLTKKKRNPVRWTSVLIISGGRNYRQNVDEYVDNIHVQIQCSENVFLRADRHFVIATDHQLSAGIENKIIKVWFRFSIFPSFQYVTHAAQNLLINQIHAEQECAARCINQVNDRSFEEHCDNAKQHE